MVQMGRDRHWKPGPRLWGPARLSYAGQVYGDQGRPARWAGDLEGAVDRCGALGQPGQAAAAGGVGAARAVVADDDVQPVPARCTTTSAWLAWACLVMLVRLSETTK